MARLARTEASGVDDSWRRRRPWLRGTLLLGSSFAEAKCGAGAVSQRWPLRAGGRRARNKADAKRSRNALRKPRRPREDDERAAAAASASSQQTRRTEKNKRNARFRFACTHASLSAQAVISSGLVESPTAQEALIGHRGPSRRRATAPDDAARLCYSCRLCLLRPSRRPRACRDSQGEP